MSFVFAVCLAIALVNPPVTEKEKAMAVTGTATAETTSMTITNLDGLASVEFSALDPMGSFATSSAEESVSFTLTTNNYTGYTLGIVAEDDNGFLAATANPGETPDTLASIGEITATSDFSAATTDAAENYNGKWGFRPSKYVSGNDVITNDSDDPVYFPSPTTTPTMLDKTSAANAADASNEYTIALGVRANYTIHSGQYSRVFQLMVLANPVSYSVAYNKNTADTVTGMPSTQASSSMIETSLTLSNAVPTRDHYSFIGWCSTTTTATNGVDSCSGTIYNPNGGGTNLTYGIDKTTTNETTLYAMWKIDTFTLTLAKGSNITNITASPNDTNGVYNYGQEITLTATKATDTTCKSYAAPTWSTTAGTLSATSGNSVTITMPASNVTVTAISAESNVSQTITLSKGTGVNGITIDGTKYTGTSASLTCGQHTVAAPAANFDSGYEFSSWAISGSASLSSTSSATTTMTVNGAGTLTLNGKSSKLYLQNVTSATCPTTATTAYDSRDEEAYTIQKLADGKCWLLDNLRLDLSTTRSLTTANTNITSNWTAPTDITTWSDVYDAPKINTESKNTTKSYGSGSGKIGVYYNYCAATAGTYCYSYGSGTGNATSDICPKGWRMPTGGSSGEYQALYTAYSSNATNFKNALRTPLSGGFNDSSAVNQGSFGFFWSATRINVNDMYLLLVYSSNVNPQNYISRDYGFSVRCVLK